MSSSNSPPNPGQPKRPPNAPPSSALRRAAPGLLAGGTALTLLWAYFSVRSVSAPNLLRTPGVKKIERAYRGAGATGTHTPAYGGTIQGKRDDESFRGDAQGTLHQPGPPQMKSGGKRDLNVSGPNPKRDGPDGGGSRDLR